MICTLEVCGHYGCSLRRKGIRVSPKATPTKNMNMRPTPMVPPAVNANIMYDVRPDGSKMPLLNPDGSVVRHKQFVDNRNSIEATMRRLRTTPKE